MNAGRELDAIVAEQVMGWTHEEIYEIPGLKSYENGAPFYSTDIASAWEIAENMRARGLCLYFQDRRDYFWVRFGQHQETGSQHEGVPADTAPAAICLAALKAVGYTP